MTTVTLPALTCRVFLSFELIACLDFIMRPLPPLCIFFGVPIIVSPGVWHFQSLVVLDCGGYALHPKGYAFFCGFEDPLDVASFRMVAIFVIVLVSSF